MHFCPRRWPSSTQRCAAARMPSMRLETLRRLLARHLEPIEFVLLLHMASHRDHCVQKGSAVPAFQLIELEGREDTRFWSKVFQQTHIWSYKSSMSHMWMNDSVNLAKYLTDEGVKGWNCRKCMGRNVPKKNLANFRRASPLAQLHWCPWLSTAPSWFAFVWKLACLDQDSSDWWSGRCFGMHGDPSCRILE